MRGPRHIDCEGALAKGAGGGRHDAGQPGVEEHARQHRPRRGERERNEGAEEDRGAQRGRIGAVRVVWRLVLYAFFYCAGFSAQMCQEVRKHILSLGT